MNEQRRVFRGLIIELAVVIMTVMVTVTLFDERENISCGDDGGFGDGSNCDENDDDHGNDAERMNGGRRGMVGG